MKASLLGKHQGPTRKYYKNGALMAEFEYDRGMVQPGLKEYKRDGSLDYIPLENRVGRASIPNYIRPGAPVDVTVRIRAELPTMLGNVYVKDYTYRL